MTVNSLVHCHVCPLKDLCDQSEHDASFRWHNQSRWKYSNPDSAPIMVGTQPDDFSKLSKATANCPLRRAVAIVDTKLMLELRRKMGR
jgi:hypothetical protein